MLAHAVRLHSGLSGRPSTPVQAGDGTTNMRQPAACLPVGSTCNITVSTVQPLDVLGVGWVPTHSSER